MPQILVIVLIVSGLIFIYPIYLYWKIYKVIKEHNYHHQWILLVLFLFFFLFGYLITANSIMSKNETASHQILEGFIFVMGMLFVILTTRVSYYVIKALIDKRTALAKAQQKMKKQNQHLEKLVAERTQKLEQSHQRAQERSKQLQEMREHLVFIAAHELRSPVTAISWNLQELEKLIKKKDYNTRVFNEIIADITSSNLHLSELVNDLLDISRLEQGTFKFRKTVFDLGKMISSLINELSTLAQEKGVKVNFRQPKTAIKIKSDQQRVREILTNLFNNAIKYNLPGGFVDIAIGENRDKIKIAVSDSGIGIANQDQKKLFKKFSRLDNEITRNVKGTGLGLYISRHLAKKLGGDISVKSAGRNQGSTFTLTLRK